MSYPNFSWAPYHGKLLGEHNGNRTHPSTMVGSTQLYRVAVANIHECMRAMLNRIVYPLYSGGLDRQIHLRLKDYYDYP